jgi:hypothetical protein
LFKKLVSKLSQAQLSNLGRRVQSKDELTNGLFELLDKQDIKPAEILNFVSLFDDATFRDAT